MSSFRQNKQPHRGRRLCVSRLTEKKQSLPIVYQVFLISALIGITPVKGSALERISKYGCEGTVLDIQCQEGTVINLVRANFGRFSISVCNPVGNPDWSVNCMEPRTLRVINARCDAKPSCQIPVDAALFGDPCPGTHKYVEVHYNCQPVKRPKTTPKPLPPWLLDLAATPASVTQSTTTTTTTTTTASTTTTAAPAFADAAAAAGDDSYRDSSTNAAVEKSSVSTASSAPPQSPLATTTSLNEDRVTQSTASTELVFNDDELEIIEEMVDHCPPQTVRNLFWNWTQNGQEAIQVCPLGSTGFARWDCGQGGEWSSKSPNLGECQSLWLSRLEARLHDIGTIDSIGSELAALTETKSMYGGDIPIVTSIIQGLAHRLRQELYVIPSQDEKEIKVNELMQNVLKTASNLLSETQFLAWMDMPADKRATYATALLLGIEDNTLLLAEIINNESNVIESTNNILASIRIMRARDANDQVFPHLETVRWEEDSRLVIPANSLLETSVNGASRVVFFLYNNLEDILPGRGTKFINTKILGATMAKAKTTHLAHPVIFTLRHLQSENIRNAECAAWNYSKRKWSTKQCAMLKSNATHTVCKCHQISNYAVLVEDRPSAAPHATSENGEDVVIAQDDYITPTIIAIIVAIALCFLLCVLFILIVRHFDLKPRVQKLVQGNGGKGIFRCKKSDSTTSSCGFYPPLTSSPTSTTVSSGTPTNQTYLEQVLKAHNSEFQIKPGTAQRAGPQQEGTRTIYRTTLPPGTTTTSNGRHLVALNQCDPFGHHIYMEIDPIYAHLESESHHSDIQLSDISDDDLQRRGHHLRQHAHQQQAHLGEERPLIRNHNLRRSIEQQLALQALQQQGLDPRQVMTTHRVPSSSSSSSVVAANGQGVATVSGNPVAGGSTGRLLLSQTAQRRPKSHRHYTLQQQQQKRLIYPVNSNSVSSQAAAANLEAPITIALQGGEQFVSLKIDQDQQEMSPQSSQHQQSVYQ